MQYFLPRMFPSRYYVCNKFNIWPQRKDKFIKFPSTLKGLKRRKHNSEESRLEKIGDC